MTGRLHDALSRLLPDHEIFMDVDDTPAGVDFRDHINGYLDKCGAALVMIGPDWLSAEDDAGGRRLDRPDDLVRLEVAAALGRAVPVIPVLVEQAPMPSEHDLPDTLKDLAWRNARPLRKDPDFRRDAEEIADELRKLLPAARGPGWLKPALVGVVVAACAAAAWMFWPKAPVDFARDDRVATRSGDEVVIRPLKNDVGDAIDYGSLVVTQPEQGLVTLSDDVQSSGAVIYTAPLDFTGTVTFEYTVIDKEHGPDGATVRIDVGATLPTPTPSPEPTPVQNADGGQPKQIVPYDAEFLGKVEVPLPHVTSQAAAGDLLDGKVLDYVHYSLVMDERRAMPLYVAINFDRGRMKKIARGTGRWRIDPRIDRDLQRGQAVYVKNVWDRGHLASRTKLVWGDTDEEAKAGGLSAHYYTNTVPQHQNFNQGIWLLLERFVQSMIFPDAKRLSIFTGPVHRRDDIEYRGARIPRSFWKIVAAEDPANPRRLQVAGFIMHQYDHDGADGYAVVAKRPEKRDPIAYQVRLADIENLVPLSFGRLKDFEIKLGVP